MKHLIALLCVLAPLVLPVRAQDVAAPPAEDWAQLRAQAADLRSRAKLMRTQADKTRVESEAFCREKFLMASCLEDARKARQEAERATHRVELEALGIERRIRVREHELKLERRAEKQQAEEARRLSVSK
ncbi:MAG: hypothetical protein Q8L56_03955 [Rhodocyclaceae bacterium]|nr:hypothetical protein [Rhodocyclaceae bacterium]